MAIQISDPGMNVINIFGDSGIGKTYFIKEFIKFAGDKDVCKQNMLYMEFKQLNTMQDCEKFFYKQLNIEPNPDGTIFILDSVDHLEEKFSEFQLNLTALLEKSDNNKLMLIRE